MRRTVLLFSLSLALVSPTMTLAQSAAPDAADVRYREGNAAYKQKRYAEAKVAYEDAFRRKQTHDIAANLGFAEIKLELWREAATHLSFALRNWAPTGKAASRESAMEFLTAAKEKIATLVLAGPAGAELLIDGKPVGTAPIEELFVDPGAHTVGARREGFEPAEQTVQAEKGKTLPVTLNLVPVAPPAPPPPMASAEQPPPRSDAPLKRAPLILGPNKAIVIGGSVVTGAAVIAGVVLVAVSNGKAATAESTRATLVANNGAGACTGQGVPPSCSTVVDAIHGKNTFGSAAAWTFIGAGAVGAATLIYALTARRVVETGRVRVTPTAALGGGGLVITGAW
jgi:hypothetical protein